MPPPAGSTARGYLDTPAEGQEVSGVVNGSGWGLFVSGSQGYLPSRGVVLVDDAIAAQAEVRLGLSRPDVRSYFADRGIVVPTPTGFSFTWNSAAVTSGAHTLSIHVYDSSPSGRSYEIARVTVNVR